MRAIFGRGNFLAARAISVVRTPPTTVQWILLDVMNLEDILKEDARRMVRLNQPYDPADGEAEGDPIDFERCGRDFEYWAARCCYVKNKGGGPDIHFILNQPQRKLVRELEKMRTAGKPIRLILLKARQWGGSTCTQLYMAWLQMIKQEGLNSLIVAHQHAATSEIKEMFLRMMESYPEEGMPKSGEDNKRRGKEKKERRFKPAGPASICVPSRNFKVKLGSAERPDSCRGGDYTLVHCSEVAVWKKTRLRTPEDMLRAACSGVLYKPMTMILLESTANGTGNFFHTEYESAKRGESQFRPLFVAWYEIKQYSEPFEEGEREEFALWLLNGKDNPEPENSRSQSGQYLWWLWTQGATLEAINWYVKERSKYSDHGQMASEYPSDDIEAFVHSGARVFDRYRVEALRTGCSLPFKKGEITGEKPYGPESLKNLRFIEDSQGNLKVWKLPEYIPNVKIYGRYLTVVDIGGRSAKADWSVIVVFDRLPMTEGEGPEVVAQWRGHSDFDLLAWNAARIAKAYGNSLLVIESNTLETHDRDRNVEGDQSNFLLNQLREVYRNLYYRRKKPEDIKPGMPVKYGFHTNIATKPLIITNLVKVVREGLYTERDPMCLDEFLTYEQRQDGSYGALSGKHDDLLMTRAIGLHVCFNEMEPPRKILITSDNTLKPNKGSYAAF